MPIVDISGGGAKIILMQVRSAGVLSSQPPRLSTSWHGVEIFLAQSGTFQFISLHYSSTMIITTVIVKEIL